MAATARLPQRVVAPTVFAMTETANPFQPTSPLWRAAAAVKARNRMELAALPPLEAQARVSHHLPLDGTSANVREGGGREGQRGLLGLAGLLAAGDR